METRHEENLFFGNVAFTYEYYTFISVAFTIVVDKSSCVDTQ